LNHLVSVIIPAFDAAQFLPSAVESARAQTRQPFEIIVVDDGSGDATAVVADAFDGVRYVRQPHRGAAAARNAGIAVADGDVFAFLDADDLWDPAKTRLQVDVLGRNPQIGYVLCHKQDFFEPGTAAAASRERGSVGDPTVALVPSALLVRRTVVDAIGAFDDRLSIGEDREWFVRAEAAGIERVILPAVLVHRRVHDANLSAKTPSSGSGWVRALKSHLDRTRRTPGSGVRRVG
jgi:glycosyltransferase involved in cell wall biosynthesis